MGSKTRQATCFLMFSAMSEIMLSLYEETTMMSFYDSALHTKLKNLKVNFERVSKRAHNMFPENEQLIFFHMITVFEKLIESAKNEKKFEALMDIINSWTNGDLSLIESKKQLLEIADLAKENKESNEL